MSEYKCWCHECTKDVKFNFGGVEIPYSMTRMILCPDCGNKRCPKATNHELACTHSNEPGQKGSRYP
jgi:DNA-directed RNA polymerase subunit RPC12/RpoP